VKSDARLSAGMAVVPEDEPSGDEPEMEICELGNYNIVISTGRLGRAECAGPICWILGGEMLDE